MSDVLEGVKVLDLSRILAGPYCAQMLADLGAKVTKVEAPWGDDTRGWGPPFLEDGTAAYHVSCNRGKEIIFHNLKEDKQAIQNLISQSEANIKSKSIIISFRLVFLSYTLIPVILPSSLSALLAFILVSILIFSSAGIVR